MNFIGRLHSVRLCGAVLAFCIPGSPTSADTFESRSIVQVHPTVTHIGPADEKQVPALPQRALENDLVIITTPKTLNEVVTKLDLANRWGTEGDEIRLRLERMIRTEVIKGTDLIEIKVRAEDPKEAQSICQAVTETYKQRREAEERDRANRAQAALEAEIRRQEDVVEEKRTVFHAIVKAVAMPYVEGAGVRQTPGEELTIREIEKERLQLNARVKTLENLEGKERREYAAGLDLPGNPALGSYAVLQEAIRALKSLSESGIEANHPAYRRQASRVEFLTELAQRSADQFLETLRAQLQEKSHLLAAREKAGEDARHQVVDRALATRDYRKAKEDYEMAKDILHTMKVSFSAKRIALSIPKLPVTIHEEANLPTVSVKE